MSLQNLHNMNTFTNAIRLAFASYAKNVTDNQGLLKDRVAIVAKVFEALKMAGPPLSLIGAFGSAVAGQVKVHDGLDERSRFTTLTSGTSSGFFTDLVKRFDDLREEKLRVGPNLSSFANEATLHVTLDEVYKGRMKEMEEALHAVCEEHFGKTSEVLQRLRDFVGNKATENHGGIVGRIGVKGETSRDAKGGLVHGAPPVGQANTERMICLKIEAYQNELLREMAPAITVPVLFDSPEAAYAIEILLYCNYIVALYENKKFFGKPIAPGISNIFAREKPWGVLSLGLTHDQAVMAKRLKWEDDENRRKTLVMFCDWYLKNINPFMLITREKRNGEQYSPELIARLCREQIDKINTAVNAGRTKGALGSNWDWGLINKKYAVLNPG